MHKMTDKEHCWHHDGLSESRGLYAGSEQVICCNCGVRGTRDYILTQDRLSGHGPFYRISFQHYTPVTLLNAGDPPTCAPTKTS